MVTHELHDALELVRGHFIPASTYFCKQKVVHVSTSLQLTTAFLNAKSDPNLKKLPVRAQEELRAFADATSRSSGTPANIWKRFLGGLNEGQSTGLRKWFSNHSKGLEVASKLEDFIMSKLQLSPREWIQFRQMANKVILELKACVPSWAQIPTHAHPHVPFWSRVETGLSRIANFDPDDKDVLHVVPTVSSSSSSSSSSGSGIVLIDSSPVASPRDMGCLIVQNRTIDSAPAMFDLTESDNEGDPSYAHLLTGPVDTPAYQQPVPDRISASIQPQHRPNNISADSPLAANIANIPDSHVLDNTRDSEVLNQRADGHVAPASPVDHPSSALAQKAARFVFAAVAEQTAESHVLPPVTKPCPSPIRPGDLVEMLHWRGQEGPGWVTKVHEDSTFDIKMIMGGVCLRVPSARAAREGNNLLSDDRPLRRKSCRLSEATDGSRSVEHGEKKLKSKSKSKSKK